MSGYNLKGFALVYTYRKNWLSRRQTYAVHKHDSKHYTCDLMAGCSEKTRLFPDKYETEKFLHHLQENKDCLELKDSFLSALPQNERSSIPYQMSIRSFRKKGGFSFF